MRSRTVWLRVLPCVLVLPLAVCACSSPTDGGDAPISSSSTEALERPAAQACGAVDLGLELGGRYDLAAQRARQVYEAALACDKEALVKITTEDSTELSLGVYDSLAVFDIPNPEGRYEVITRLMSTPPGDIEGTMYWPYWETPEDLDRLEAAGVLSPEMRMEIEEYENYFGWSMSFSQEGKLTGFFEGD